MEQLYRQLKQQNLVYVTRDIERALILPPDTEGYFIIANSTPFAKSVAEGKANVLLIENETQLDTRELLAHKTVIDFINERAHPHLLVFKNTPQIEQLCEQYSWKLLNPSAALGNRIEEKISQLDWLGKAALLLPPHRIAPLKELRWEGIPFILQFNRAHTGTGTKLIESAEALRILEKQFPDRPVRVTDYIDGPVLTSNNIVAGDQILPGNISYQITGLAPLTDERFATVGNDFGLPEKLLSEVQQKQYRSMVQTIGQKLYADGWRGLFGIDVALDPVDEKLYLIEINARQPASAAFESQLQQKQRDKLPRLTTGEAHVATLYGLTVSLPLIPLANGAQVVQRVTKDVTAIPTITLLKPMPFRFIAYQNTKPNTDLLRVQSDKNIMTGHNQLSAHGIACLRFISHSKHGNPWGVERAGVIMVRDEQILLMKRVKPHDTYYVIPGGSREEGETIKECALREVKEETNLDVILTDDSPIVCTSGIEEDTGNQYYFIAAACVGEAKIIGEELEFDCETDQHILEWVPLSQLSTINLLPNSLKEKILDRFQIKNPSLPARFAGASARRAGTEKYKIENHSNRLSGNALSVIDHFLHLKIGNTTLPCPYFNNRRAKVRAGLRVLIGKGSPEDIEDEARIMALKDRIDLYELDVEQARRFLVDHNLGIDCSAFVYYVLAAEVKARNERDIRACITFARDVNPFRKLIQKFRPVENINVAILASDENSVVIAPEDVRPGDLIIMLGSGERHDRDHVLLVEATHAEAIHYIHALQWSIDGKYHHGVRRGTITLAEQTKPLVEQIWEEQGKTGQQNETLAHARSAQILQLRRLRALV